MQRFKHVPESIRNEKKACLPADEAGEKQMGSFREADAHFSSLVSPKSLIINSNPPRFVTKEKQTKKITHSPWPPHIIYAPPFHTIHCTINLLILSATPIFTLKQRQTPNNSSRTLLQRL